MTPECCAHMVRVLERYGSLEVADQHGPDWPDGRDRADHRALVRCGVCGWTVVWISPRAPGPYARISHVHDLRAACCHLGIRATDDELRRLAPAVEPGAPPPAAPSRRAGFRLRTPRGRRPARDDGLTTTDP